jgi:hypothetical protein
VWTDRLEHLLDEAQPCSTVFLISQSLLSILAAEHDVPSIRTLLQIGPRTLVNMDAKTAHVQQFDTVYWQCHYWRCDCPSCERGNYCYCPSTNQPTVGLHKLIIPPPNLTVVQAEVYTVLRQDDMDPADAAEAAQLLA